MNPNTILNILRKGTVNRGGGQTSFRGFKDWEKAIVLLCYQDMGREDLGVNMIGLEDRTNPYYNNHLKKIRRIIELAAD